MSEEVGGMVEAVCGKCGETPHVVIAVTKGKAAQVECKECSARHKFRPVAAAAKPAKKAARKSARKAAGSTAAARRKAAKKKPVAEADTSRPPRPFLMTDTYQVGDRVVHDTFGEGIVQAVAGPTKVEILFDVGSKMMVQGRSAG